MNDPRMRASNNQRNSLYLRSIVEVTKYLIFSCSTMHLKKFSNTVSYWKTYYHGSRVTFKLCKNIDADMQFCQMSTTPFKWKLKVQQPETPIGFHMTAKLRRSIRNCTWQRQAEQTPTAITWNGCHESVTICAIGYPNGRDIDRNTRSQSVKSDADWASEGTVMGSSRKLPNWRLLLKSQKWKLSWSWSVVIYLVFPINLDKNNNINTLLKYSLILLIIKPPTYNI